MRDVTLRFINDLRAAGLRISLSESMDAVQAVAAVGIERELLREALAASLVKEEEDRPLFDEVFTRFFAGLGSRRKNTHHKKASAGEGQRLKANGVQARAQEQPPEQRHPGERPAHEQPQQPSQHTLEPKLADSTKQQSESRRRGSEDRDLTPDPRPPTPSRKTLLEKPFKAFDSRDVEAVKELVEDLARRLRGRLSRRYKRSKRGRLDFRRTIRASIAHGGVPLDLLLRGRRPGKPDLVALCDLSGSVAVVSDF